MSEANYPISSLELINWRLEEPHCSKPVLKLVLNETIQPSALQIALDQTIQRYQILQLTTSENTEIVYTKAKMIHPIEDILYESPVSLQAEEGYAPWRICYHDNYITFYFHHGLMDGRAAFEVLKTLLYYYALELGKDVSLEGIRTLDDPQEFIEEESKDPVKKCYKEGLTPLKEKTPLQASPFKEGVTASPQYCRLFVDKNAFMKKVKELETSPFALTAVLLARSFEGYYESKPTINVGIVADYRTIFGIDSMHNFISMSTISYESENMDDKSLALACTMFRSVLDVMLQKENVNKHFEDSLKLSMALRPSPLSDQAKQILQYIRSIQSSTSLIISYIGRFLLPEGLKDMVKDLYVYVPSGSANLIEMIDLNDQFILNIHHSFNNVDFIHSLQKELESLGITSHFENDIKTPVVHL